MVYSFFVLSGQYPDLARDEIINLGKAFDENCEFHVYPRLVLVKTHSWREIAKRASFVKYCGIVSREFLRLSDIDLSITPPKSFVCKTINLAKKDTPSIDWNKLVGEKLKEKWDSKVSFERPDVTIYIIITDFAKYLGYLEGCILYKLPKKQINYPHELDEKLARCLVNLSGVKKGEMICDPFCGTGTILLHARSMGIKSVGIDFDEMMCDITKKNLSHNKCRAKVINSDFSEFKKIKEIDAIVTDLPYGISSKSSAPPKNLLKNFVSMVPKSTKLVIVYKKGHDPKNLRKAKKYEIYKHKSLTRVIAIR